MSRYIFVNIAVKDVQRSIAFFTALGFSFEPKYTGENSACMIVDENIFVMMLAESYFKTFTKKEIVDATKSTEVLLALSCASRQQVDETAAKALAQGGKLARDPEDHGFMYQQAIEDLDGHIWELAYMEPGAQG